MAKHDLKMDNEVSVGFRERHLQSKLLNLGYNSGI
jgi:hypothetical protein